MPDIFLSYTREDQATAQRFAEAFEAQGFSVWWDATLRSGEAYDQVTEEALRTAKAVVVLWSKKSVVSRWVRAEATLADRNRTLVPAMIEPCERPIMFELTQTADLSAWKGDAQDPAWRAFLADVRRFVVAVGASQLPEPRPLAQASVRRPSQSARPSLAVLPFVNRSGDEEEDFVEGMVVDLTAALSSSPWMKVVASRATAGYRNATADLRQIGQDLGVRYLLEGNVRRVGEDLRVTAQLVEAEGGAILWSQRFDRPLVEVSALQDDLVAEVAAHLHDQVHRIEMDQALKTPGMVSAWEAAMRADAFSGHGTRAGFEAAIAEHKRVLEFDPDDAEVRAKLVAGQGQLWRLRSGDPELAREIYSNIRRLRAADPHNPLVLNCIASALGGLGDLEGALPLSERAVAMSPNFEVARIVLASIRIRLGRLDAGLAELDAAERVAPNNIWSYRTWLMRSVAFLRGGRLQQALEAADRSVRLLPAPEAFLQSALCFARSNRWDLASDALRRLREMEPEISRAVAASLVRDFYRGSDEIDEYVAILGRLWDETSSEPSSP
jgi:TolB-like protein